MASSNLGNDYPANGFVAWRYQAIIPNYDD